MCYNTRARGCSSMAERQLPKLNTRVRFPSPAPASAQSPLNYVSGNSLWLLPKTAFAPLRLLPNPKHSASDLFFLLRAKSAQLRFRQQPAALPKTAFTTLRLLSNPKHFGFGFVFYYLADFVSFATTIFLSEQSSSLIHSVAPPFQIEPAALGFNFDKNRIGAFKRCKNTRTTTSGQSPFGSVSGK